ncbi:mesenteric estrogen-dependent adipogenesis protein [Carassius auratus]|uniref:Mesenteric estrogen-dependent adipogenesis protein n=1 Tax=Carassius auratus TaxID=7957 RepID=A0A6P6P9J9_CARAU|nr:mesenteric estrogen-dependent adipogenesis protein-like [Carassius auratus]XP_052463822.1 mesenteric estrogen-dependent adipogenesis protein [Carassius gibelio]
MKKRESMNPGFVMDIVELESFVNSPPRGFFVESRADCRVVKWDPENSCVFIDEVQTSEGKVIFCNSPGRKVIVRTLGEYTDLRRQLTSKTTYILVSACTKTKVKEKRKDYVTALGYYVVAINGRHPMIKWEMERGLDMTISSVAGESYSVDVDVSAALQGWVGESFQILDDGEKVKPIWRDTHFIIEYCSDALFDFPYWFGFSKRQFTVSYHGRGDQHPKCCVKQQISTENRHQSMEI